MSSTEQIEVSEKEIEIWLKKHIAEVMKIEVDDIDVEADFEKIGLDSITMVQITEDLSQWLGKSIDPTLLYENNSIKSVSKAIL